MLELLSTIVDSISGLIKLAISSISSLVNILVNLPSYVDFLIHTIDYLPDIVVPFVTVSVFLFVVLFIIGK